jgi:GTP-binding protein
MQIKEAKYLVSSAEYTQCPTPNKPEFAFIGRSNVGKSSLINMLMGQKGLAKTSANPGKTQLINHFTVKSAAGKQQVLNWYMVDLPGYGYAKIAQSTRRRWEQMIENYLRKRENLVQVFVLVDARHEPQKIDIEFVNQLGLWEVPFTIVFTKADKVKPMALRRNVEDFFKAMAAFWSDFPHNIITSAETKLGKEQVLDWMEEFLLEQ